MSMVLLPNVVHAHHVFRENGTAYIVMEFVNGQSLKAMVEAYKEKTKEAEQKPSIMKELSEPMIKVTAATPTVKPPVVGGDAR